MRRLILKSPNPNPRKYSPEHTALAAGVALTFVLAGVEPRTEMTGAEARELAEKARAGLPWLRTPLDEAPAAQLKQLLNFLEHEACAHGLHIMEYDRHTRWRHETDMSTQLTNDLLAFFGHEATATIPNYRPPATATAGTPPKVAASPPPSPPGPLVTLTRGTKSAEISVEEMAALVAHRPALRPWQGVLTTDRAGAELLLKSAAVIDPKLSDRVAPLRDGEGPVWASLNGNPLTIPSATATATAAPAPRTVATKGERVARVSTDAAARDVAAMFPSGFGAPSRRKVEGE